MSKRLNQAALAGLPDHVARPDYDRAALKPGVVHFGIGAFHRAHQAWYFDALARSGETAWGVVGVSLRSASVADQMNPQDGLYTVVERDSDGDQYAIIGSVSRVLVAGADSAAIIALLASPDVQLVTMTVTEKGYCHDPATGKLLTSHADIGHDLANPDAPRSLPGFLVAGLAARMAAGAGPVTLLSCDNLPHNGRVLGGIVAAVAAARSPELAAWIAANVRFPSSMIDRIVPATTADDRAALAAVLGVDDAAMVKAEPFSQWVIEDDFAGARPPLDRVGAQLVADVTPFELAKLRMLNGSHSLIAYAGLARGHVTVDQAVADPSIRVLVDALMAEAAATLPHVPGLDPAAYADQLAARFANRALGHQLAQIAMDGSQKLPQRLVGTLVDSRELGVASHAAAAGIAAWLLHLTGPHLNDPLADELRAIGAAAGGDITALAAAGCGFAPVFGDVAGAPWLVGAVRDGLARLVAGVEALA